MAGLHINSLLTPHLDYIERVRPGVNLLFKPKAEEASLIKERSPESKLIGRPTFAGGDGEGHNWYLGAGTAEGARAGGKRAAEFCLSQGVPQVDAWAFQNEPPTDELEQIRLLAEFDAEFARAMSRGRSKACIGTFARGTPQIPRLDGGQAIMAYYPALRVAYDVGAWLAIHQYAKRVPYLDEAEYHALRWQREIFPWLKAKGLLLPRYVITEAGTDKGTGDIPNDGWRAVYGDSERGREAYASDLQMIMGLYASDPLCIGATIFCAGNGWDSFRVDGPLLDHLATISWPKFSTAVPLPSPTPTPKPETPMPIPSPIKPPHTWSPSPNFSPGRGIHKDVIVWHHTAPGDALSWLRDEASGVSSDYLVLKTGKIHQLVADNNVAWHAGYSLMPDGREGVNNFSYGIELENDGDGKDPYPPAQIDAAVALARYLVAKNDIRRSNQVTHELIRRLWKEKYPGRLDELGRPIHYKTDPRGLDMVKLLDRIYAPAAPVAPINQMIELAKASQLVSPNPQAALTKAAVKAAYVSQLGNEQALGEWIFQLWGNPASGKEALVYVKKGDWGNVVVRGL